MNSTKILGWILIIVGITILSLPLISGFTGFFSASYYSDLPKFEFGLNMQIVIVGAALMLIGVILANPRKKTFLSGF